MALSNIFREPLKEIAETVVGVAFFGAVGATVIAVAYGCGRVMQLLDPRLEIVPASIAGLLLAVASGTLLYVAHILGEGIVANWQDRRRMKRLRAECRR